MKLTELDPQFIRFERVDGRITHTFVDRIEDAQGIEFLCPVCFVKNGGPMGTHGVICWSRSRGAPEDATPGPGRWQMVGAGLHDLTLNGDAVGNPGAGARSVQLGGGCEWHGFITNGEVTNA